MLTENVRLKAMLLNDSAISPCMYSRKMPAETDRCTVRFGRAILIADAFDKEIGNGTVSSKQIIN